MVVTLDEKRTVTVGAVAVMNDSSHLLAGSGTPPARADGVRASKVDSG